MNMRINKYLSASGVLSRREADRYILAGRITIDGRTATMGERVSGNEEIAVDGEIVKSPDAVEKVVLAYYKEKGVVCSTVNQGREKNCIIDRLSYPVRVYPIGRLDKDTEGLILLTNDGELVNKLLKGVYGHEKEYEVTLNENISDDVLLAMERGALPLLPDRKSRPCSIKRIDEKRFLCVLTEGMNRQIHRMAEYFGHSVAALKRLRFGDITLDGLSPGGYRVLDEAEISGLKGKIR